MDKEFVIEMIAYMKDNRDMTIAEKCNALGVSVAGYYKACKRFGLNGNMRRSGRSGVDIENARKIMAYARKVKAEATTQDTTGPIDQQESSTSICTQAQDFLE